MRISLRLRAAAICLWTAIAAQADHTIRRPWSFEAEGTGFVARSTRGGVRINPDGFTLAPTPTGGPIEFRWTGSCGARLTGGKTSGVANRFPSPDPTGWRAGMPLYGKVKVTGLYPGIDAIYYFRGQTLEFDLILRPGSDVSALRLHPPHGSRFEIAPDGSATVRGPSGTYAFRNPETWQMREGRRIPVKCTYLVAPDGSLRFKPDGYDPSLDLTIDPIVEAMTYLGGAGIDRVQAAAVDADGNLVLAGITDSANFPGTGTRDARSLSIFVVKLNRSGSQVLFATTLGLRPNYSSLTPSTWVNSIVAAPDGSIYVAGYWSGNAFPTTRGAWQTYSAGAFLTRLDSAGNVAYSTMVGAPEWGLSVTRVRERDGVVYVAGSASRPEFYGTSNAYQRSLAGFNDFYVMAIEPSGAAPIFVTALGGAGNDVLYDMSLAADGSILVAGTSSSKDFPGETGEGGVVARLDATGSRLLTAAGFKAQSIYGLALLPGGDVAIAGPAPSAEWMASVQRNTIRFPQFPNSGFAARLSGESFAPQWITELTVAGPYTGRGLSADDDGNLYWIDYTSWPSGGSLPGDRYSLYKLSADGSRMLYAGRLRESMQQTPIAAQAGDGRMLAGGATSATDLPVSPEAVQPRLDPGPAGSTQTPLNWEDAWAAIIDLSAFREGNFFALAPSAALTWRAGEPVSGSALTIPVMLSGDPGPLTASTSERLAASYTASPSPTLRVTPNPGQTVAGRFRETVTLRGANPDSALTLPVNLTVWQRVNFELATSSIEVRMREGQQEAPPTVVDIAADFGGEFFIIDVQSSNPEWLFGRVSSYQLTVGFQAVKAGTYEGTLTLRISRIENLERTLRVKLIVDPPAHLRLSTNPLRLHVVKGQPVPTASLTVSSDVPGVRWSLFVGEFRTWLKVEQSGTVTPGEIRVTVDPATVEVGYFQFKAFVSGDGAAERLEASIIVDVASGAALEATPAAVERQHMRGGTYPNYSVQICFTSPAATAVEWSTDQPWALPRKSAGTTPFCDYVWFDDSIKEGVYKGVLTARAGSTTLRVPLTWTLYDQPKLIYSASPLRFTWRMGSPPPEPQKLTFTTSTIQQEFVYLGTNRTPDWVRFDPPSSRTPATFLVSPILEGRGPGTYTAEIVVWDSRGSTGNPRIPATLEILANPNQAPSTITGVLNLASRLPGAVAPGELVVIQGTDLGPAGRLAAEPDSAGRFPTSVSGRTFYFDEVATPILSLSDKEAVVAVPYALAGRSRTSLTLEVGGRRTAPHALTVVQSAPGVFTANGSGSGAAAAGVGRDGGPVAGPASASRGGTLVVFATGLGVLSPAAPDGTVMGAIPSSSNAAVRALIGGREATVLSAATAAGLVSGVLRIEVRVPEAAPAGASPLLLLAGDNVAQPGVTVAVQ